MQIDRASQRPWTMGMGHGSMGKPNSVRPMAGQGCGELDLSPAVASLGQKLMALGLRWGPDRLGCPGERTATSGPSSTLNALAAIPQMSKWWHNLWSQRKVVLSPAVWQQIQQRQWREDVNSLYLPSRIVPSRETLPAKLMLTQHLHS